MHKTVKDQSDFELRWAQIFINFLNKTLVADFILFKSIPNKCGSDIEAYSITRNQILILELTEVKEHLENICKGINYFNADCLENSINQKILKYNDMNLDISNIILLLQGSLDSNWMSDRIDGLRNIYRHSQFRGIYYIKAPDTNEKEFVMEIKNAF